MLVWSFSGVTLGQTAVPDDKPAEVARRALQARQSGRLEESIKLFRQALAVRPVDPESWWYQGLNFYDLDRYGEAEQAFEKLTRQDPGNGAAWAFLGLCEFRNRKYKDSFAHLVFAKRYGIQSGSELERVAHYHYVMLANKIGQFELASGLLAELTKTRPDAPMLEEMAGLSALRLSLLPTEIPPDKREQVLLAGRAAVLAWKLRRDDAIKEAAALLEKYPALPNAHYLMGYLLLLQHSDRALDEFRKELEISPNHIQARLQIAYEYMQRGQAEKGLPYAQEAVRLGPNDFTAHNICGRLLLDQNRLDEAIKHLETAVKLAPTSPEAHFHLSNAYSRSGRKELAEKHRKAFRALQKARQGQRAEGASDVQR